MVGGRDYVNSSYNRATQANRQPGSSFKLFVYLTALEAGYRPDSVVDGSPISVGGWSPRNDSGRVFGEVPMRAAFAYSINTAAVRLAQEVGTRAVADMAQRFGITTRISTNPSMALGSSEVRLIDMTRAYAAVARGGVAVTPYGIRRVTTADGTLLYQHQPDQSRVLVAPWVAQQMTELLQDVVEHGTGRGAQLGRPTAGKTGTTSSNKDGWFIGFSSGLTTGVWMGRDDNRALPGLAGGRAPAAAFHDLMARAVANRPVEPFATDAAAPDWAIEGDNEIWFAPPDDQPLVDEDGNPIEPAPPRRGRQGRSARRGAAPRGGRAAARSAEPGLARPRDRPPRAPRAGAARAGTQGAGPARAGPGRNRRARAGPAAAPRARAQRPGARRNLSDGLARPDPVQRSAFALQPGAGRPRVGAEQLFDQSVKLGAVVEMDEVRDLVRDRGAADEIGDEDQPPAVADRAPARAAAPARHRIANADARRHDAGPDGEFPGFPAEQLERLGLEPAQQPSLQAFGGAARHQPALAPFDPPRPRRIPVDPVRRAVERDDGAGREGGFGRDVGQRPLDPVAVPARPGERAPLRHPLRHRQHDGPACAGRR